MSLLQVRDVQAAYGESQVLFGLGLSLQPGEVMGLLGRNGMGKSTLIRSLLGHVAQRQGQHAVGRLGADRAGMAAGALTEAWGVRA